MNIGFIHKPRLTTRADLAGFMCIDPLLVGLKELGHTLHLVCNPVYKDFKDNPRYIGKKVYDHFEINKWGDLEFDIVFVHDCRSYFDWIPEDLMKKVKTKLFCVYDEDAEIPALKETLKRFDNAFAFTPYDEPSFDRQIVTYYGVKEYSGNLNKLNGSFSVGYVGADFDRKPDFEFYLKNVPEDLPFHVSGIFDNRLYKNMTEEVKLKKKKYLFDVEKKPNIIVHPKTHHNNTAFGNMDFFIYCTRNIYKKVGLYPYRAFEPMSHGKLTMFPSDTRSVRKLFGDDLVFEPSDFLSVLKRLSEDKDFYHEKLDTYHRVIKEKFFHKSVTSKFLESLELVGKKNYINVW